jgi:hypothetical protein
MRKITILAAVLGVLNFASDAYVWGDEWHKTVCQIAFDKVKPSTRAAIVS